MDNPSDDDYVQCQLCFGKFKAITGMHAQRRHNMSLMTYKRIFPNVPVYTHETYKRIRNGGIKGGEIIKQIIKNKRPTIHKHRGQLNPKKVKKIKERDNNSCLMYENYCSKRLEIHHIIRLTFFSDRTIADDIDNLVTLCSLHHSFFEDFPARAYILFDKLQIPVKKRNFLLSQTTIPEKICYKIQTTNFESQKWNRDELLRISNYKSLRSIIVKISQARDC